MPSPLVTVVLPFYRNALVVEAVQSILNQTFRDFELIAIDDCSGNGVADLLTGIEDPRLRVVVRTENGGPGSTRNIGISQARGKYIAFQDSDDISYPERLEKQIRLLESRPDLVGCGSACHYGESRVEHILPTEPGLLRWEMIFNSHVIFSTVVVRTEVAQRRPFGDLRASEDYLWLHEIMLDGDFSNLPDYLLHYRMQPTSLSMIHSKSQIVDGNNCRKLFASDFGVECTDRQVELLQWAGTPRSECWPGATELHDLANLLERLAETATRKWPTHSSSIRESALSRVRFAATVSSRLGLGAYMAWRTLASRWHLGGIDSKLFVKCLLGGIKGSLRGR